MTITTFNCPVVTVSNLPVFHHSAESMDSLSIISKTCLYFLRKPDMFSVEVSSASNVNGKVRFTFITHSLTHSFTSI